MNLRTIEKQILDGKKLTEQEEEHVSKKVLDYWENHPDVVNRYPRWKKYMAWVAGYQSYDYNTLTKKLISVPVNKDHRLVFNRLRSFVKTLLAKLSSDIPQSTVIPNTDDDADIESARVGDRVILGLSEKFGINKVLSDIKLWLILCNRAYLRVIWDEESQGILGYGEVEEDDEQGNPTGKKILEEAIEEGDVSMEAVSPFNCRCDPLYKSKEKWRWFIYGEEVDAQEIESQYDLEKGSLKEQGRTLEDAYDLQFGSSEDLSIGTSDKSENIRGRTVVFKELWTKNVYYFIAGQKLVEYGANEYGEIPYYPMEDTLIPINDYEKGFSYNESIIKDAIPVQRQYNKTINIQSIGLDRASKLKVLTPLGSLLNKKQWVNDYGVFIDYNRNLGEPHQMKMEPFPFEVINYKSELEREMESIMNIHEASFGRLPERASHASGTLVNLLLEQDDIVLNPLLNTINMQLSKAWKLVLRMIQNNYTAERILQYTGDDGMPAIIKFQGADLLGNTDVKVVSQTGLPRSRAMRIEYIMRLRSEGLLTDDKSTLEMLEFGNASKIFVDSLLHERKAIREISLIESTPDITPEMMFGDEERGIEGMYYDGDDSEIHIKMYLRYRLSTKYDKLSPNQKAVLNALIQRHQENLQKAQESEMQQQMIMIAKTEAIKRGELDDELKPQPSIDELKLDIEEAKLGEAHRAKDLESVRDAQKLEMEQAKAMREANATREQR